MKTSMQSDKGVNICFADDIFLCTEHEFHDNRDTGYKH